MTEDQIKLQQFSNIWFLPVLRSFKLWKFTGKNVNMKSKQKINKPELRGKMHHNRPRNPKITNNISS